MLLMVVVMMIWLCVLSEDIFLVLIFYCVVFVLSIFLFVCLFVWFDLAQLWIGAQKRWQMMIEDEFVKEKKVLAWKNHQILSAFFS